MTQALELRSHIQVRVYALDFVSGTYSISRWVLGPPGLGNGMLANIDGRLPCLTFLPHARIS